MRPWAAIAVALLAGCMASAPPPQPAPAPPRPTYNEAAWSDYCHGLWARGVYDTPNGECRRLFEYQRAQQDSYEAQQRDRQAAAARDQEQRRRWRAAGNALQNKPTTRCESRQTASGTIVTDCE